MKWERMKQGLKAVWWRDIARMEPECPQRWRYLWPWLPAKQALHRKLWWLSRYRLPVLLWLPLEVVRWVYWQIWLANRHIQAFTVKRGPAVMAKSGMSVADQSQLVRYWAKRWAIAPAFSHEWGFYHPERDALDYILGGEVQPFHRLMNRRRGVTSDDYRLLFDKAALAKLLMAAGVPMARVIGQSHGDMDDLRAAIASDGPVFCKLRAGSRGESAFIAESGTCGLQGQSLTGQLLENEAEVIKAWHALTAKGEVLIQPYLRNHPILQQLSPNTETMTLRVITRADADGFPVWSGFLYVQAPGATTERWYWMMKIDAGTGQAFDAFGQWLDDEQDAVDASQLLMMDGAPLPFWQEIVRHSERAHAELPRLWTIAWDWIITPDGPVLLEGNAGWDLSPLQELGVDFVKIGCELTGVSLK